MLWGSAQVANAFWRNSQGGIAAPLALLMPVLFGFGLLAIDAGRLFNLQTSLQGGADALAVAAAAELDSRPDSIIRANRAIDSLISNDQRFGEGSAAINRSAISVRFLSSLPSNDGSPPTDGTTDPLRAVRVEVIVKPVKLNNLFAAAASVTEVTSQADATAIAGFDSVACNVTPLFMCNPFESSSTSLFMAARDPSFRLRQIAMKAKGSQYGAGNYGYLEPAYGNGGSAVKDAMAIDKPKGCYKQAGVELQTGNISSTAEAMNVRFDIYEGSFSNKKGDPSYRPAQNVRKGYTGPSCNQSVAYDPTKRPTDIANLKVAIGLPRDNCFYDGSCTFGGTMAGRIGSGDWDFQTYWTRTHGTGYPNGWSNSNRPSRYDVYRYEIANNLASHFTAGADTREKGAPVCYAGGSSTLDDELDRRTFVGAIIDCHAADEAGQLNGSSGSVIPVTAYARFFLTEPMDKHDGTIWAEMIGLVEPGTADARNIIRDSVQLYR